MKSMDRVASREYRKFLNLECGCLVCSHWLCDPCHIWTRVRADSSDLLCIPLCRRHHTEFDEAGKEKMQWLESHGIHLATAQQRLHHKFRVTRGLPDGDFESVLRRAGMIEPPYTRRKNR